MPPLVKERVSPSYQEPLKRCVIGCRRLSRSDWFIPLARHLEYDSRQTLQRGRFPVQASGRKREPVRAHERVRLRSLLQSARCRVALVGFAAWLYALWCHLWARGLTAGLVSPEHVAAEDRQFLLVSALWLFGLGAIGYVVSRAERQREQAEDLLRVQRNLTMALGSARTHVEEALRRERDFAQNLIDAAPTIIAVLDREGRILRANPFVESLIGYRLDELDDDARFFHFVPEALRPDLAELFQRILDGRPYEDRVVPLITRAGETREIEWFTRRLTDDQGQLLGVLSIGHDITELKKAQERAMQSERLAAIGQMVAGLTHESGNALQRSQACLEMLALEVQDRPAAVDLVHRIQVAQDHLHQLYEAVRRYAAPIVLRREPSHLSEILGHAWSDLETARCGRSARLVVKDDAELGPCLVDHYALRRVFRNALENSLDAAANGVAIEVAWEPIDLDGKPAVRICLRDDGPGMDPEQQRNIFEPFFTTKTHGTGLGMAISKRLVEAHGGRIAVGPRTAPGQGTEILIELPRE